VKIVQLRIIVEIHAALREAKLGEELVEAAQILLYQRETTPRCSLSRHPNTVHTVFGCREPCDEDHQSPDHR
jgi:hypothetical protein